MDWKMRRGQIKHLLYEHCLSGRITMRLLKELFIDLNNVEPVVHCKDCVHFEGVGFYCQIDRYVPTENDFCSTGKRKREVEE